MIKLPVIHCTKCGHEWVPRKAPTICPICKRKGTWKKGKVPKNANGQIKVETAKA